MDMTPYASASAGTPNDAGTVDDARTTSSSSTAPKTARSDDRCLMTAMAGQLHKTKICKYQRHGMCLHGNGCKFAHSDDELRPPPNLQKTALCQRFKAGNCNRPDCPFAHGVAERRPIPQLRSRHPQEQHARRQSDLGLSQADHVGGPVPGQQAGGLQASGGEQQGLQLLDSLTGMVARQMGQDPTGQMLVHLLRQLQGAQGIQNRSWQPAPNEGSRMNVQSVPMTNEAFARGGPSHHQPQGMHSGFPGGFGANQAPPPPPFRYGGMADPSAYPAPLPAQAHRGGMAASGLGPQMPPRQNAGGSSPEEDPTSGWADAPQARPRCFEGVSRNVRPLKQAEPQEIRDAERRTLGS
eukprot:CAMPEP_0195084822 /NCGR_PEP_ID=MMETSP0448-20130528/25416_1 /TAXON_ID=66468 /ORGANISM="Heterocapsa triquestra, Strain CCMP 448" /LENGTH=352 /DNA_ID=CAMNT_0040118179 /DNA_START=103 /DNA_END=1159 /DNA_ORIENTATION=-